jgi:hypothetical protein
MNQPPADLNQRVIIRRLINASDEVRVVAIGIRYDD